MSHRADRPIRPNILWICTDQQRFDTLGALGNAYIHTPNLDRLVQSGVAFTHAYCQSPICTPSRASFLTGMYPSSVHGCTNGNESWEEAAPLVTQLLADAGYDCGLAGKLHLAGAEGRLEPRPAHDGYRVFWWSHAPRDVWNSGHAYADWLVTQGQRLSELAKSPLDIPPALHQTTWCTDRAIEFIEEKRDQPWLFSVNPFDPHPPFDPPRNFLAHYYPADLPEPLFRESDLAAQAQLAGVDFQSQARRPSEFSAREIKAAYYAMIELIDENIGRLLDTLERTGQRENTLIIFMSDHGEMLGDHGLTLKGCRFYEGLVRVPLIISWLGRFPSGLISEALVELADLAPTLLDICGLPIPERVQGRSLRSILMGTAVPHHHRAFVRCEYYHALNPNTPQRQDWEGTFATMIRDVRYKLVVYHRHPTGELFDLHQDPGEFQNLWQDLRYTEIKLDLIKQSFDALACAVDIGSKQTRHY